MVRALVHGELTWKFNLFLMFMHVPFILSLTSQKLKKVSEILRVACDEVRKGNASIGNKFLNNVEIST